ncbi:MAG: UvrD-helicase domain-containing protein [Bacilli bacterium]|nr:UvrD-helicase domain-containing protein [Bacilli bacterium]
MAKATKEQENAINASGKNIIVSAGAGSGKTFVLKSRVKKIVTSGTKVDELIILTFTNAAAQEMKDRIRKVIKETVTEENKDELDLVESSYITTFDSFAQSIVKKYNYLLNIDKHFTIIDENIVNTELTKILNKIFLKFYENPTDEFINFTNDFCYKDDTNTINEIIKLYRSICNLKDKKEFLDNYISDFYSKDMIDKFIEEYRNIAFDAKEKIIPLYEEFNSHIITDKAHEKMQLRIERLQSAIYPEEIIEIVKERKPQNSGKTKIFDDDDIDDLKEEIKTLEDKIKEIYSKTDSDLMSEYLYTKNNVSFLINIIKQLDKEITIFKNQNNAYEFQDIALKAIELVKNNESVCEEIKNKTKEIMIDEYQDTNDIQEEFIKHISNNNVYMVGDIKQSIYRFRHANPYIFKEKYDKYEKYSESVSKDALGIKIDMTKNFRSRDEVISNINSFFSDIMHDDIGGAKFKEEHQMEAKFEPYNEYKQKDFDYNMRILNYSLPEKFNFKNNEVEAFIIAKDIKEKMSQNILVVDGDGNKNPLTYKDFCILVDKSTNFELIKKILEFNKIPVTIEKDLSIKEDDEVYILKNLISLLICIKENNYGPIFNHSFMSILRSYIYKTNDEEIFKIINEKKYKDTSLYKDLLEISEKIEGLSNKEIIIELINKFNIFSKTITVGNVKNRSTKLEYIVNNAEDLNKFGLDIYSLNDYFDRILKSDDDFKMSIKTPSKNAVRIMTMHKSKGLEFPFVYLPYLNSPFKGKKQNKIPLSIDYGIITPFKNDYYLDKTFIKSLYEKTELEENVSEKIRLLYVAITRAREQYIVINSWRDKMKPKTVVSSEDILKCKSFSDIFELEKNKLLKYTEDIDIDTIGLTKDYNLKDNTDYNKIIKNTGNKITINNISIDNKVLQNSKFSKDQKHLMTKELKEMLDYGNYLHYCFEVYDFKNNNLDTLHISDEYKEIIKKFINNREVENISSAITYKEHEFSYIDNGIQKNGIIDLLIEYDDHFDIIDYKTDNVYSEEYNEQLKGYKKYIEKTYNKTTNIYLYSIKENFFKKI